MTRLTRAQQRATRRAVEQAWQDRYIYRRQAKQALSELDSAVRHPAMGVESHRALSDWFNTPAADHIWTSPERRPVEPGPTPEQLAMFSGPPSPQGAQHIPAPTSEDIAEAERMVAEWAAKIDADEKEWEETVMKEHRRRQIIWWCIWGPALVIWIGVLVRAVGER